jgi:hypothetical protein
MRTGVRTIHLAEILASTGSDTRVDDDVDRRDAERVGS